MGLTMGMPAAVLPSVAAIPIVGIGASAGGLDAFLRLLHHLPSGTGLAYVFVQHLDPTHESLLPELLGRASALPVVQAVDGVRIEADHAYVIPPNTTMTVTDGHLRLVARKKGPGPHLPIDAFLCSLADVHG
ncbi:MAG TPA: chemotaxis protein CheB, partial [Vicinamibacterales bacterium]|nr:chemotaxis protein CheB [Vicinamibacterales bacterium]